MEPAEQTLMQSPMMQSFLLFVYTHGFWLRLGLMALLALAAVFGARLYRKLVGALRKKLARYMPEWLQILYDGFSEPLVLLLRCLLIYWAVLAAPLAAFTDGREKPEAPPEDLARDGPAAPTPPVLETFIRQAPKAQTRESLVSSHNHSRFARLKYG